MLVDGQPADSVPADDRGLRYGDGLFETLPLVDGRPALWNEHMGRLAAGCERLDLPAPDPARLRDECLAVAGDASDGVLRIQLTRGSGGRGYAPPRPAVPRRIVAFSALPERDPDCWRLGINVHLCRHRLSDQPALAGIKHLNRLDQVLARAEWRDPAIAEGLMRGQDGSLVCGTMSNLFLVRGDRLETPALDAAGVAGVMRGWVAVQAESLGLAFTETALTLQSLRDADEVFVTNSLNGVWPVTALGDQRWPVGPAAAALIRRLQADRLIAYSPLADS